jgi:DNA-binding NarL/FixJ family response regulator
VNRGRGTGDTSTAQCHDLDVTATPPIRVVLADDHPVVRRGLAALLDSVEGVAVVGQAATGREAVREAQLLAPDVVLMDVQMPDLDGVEATRRIAAASPGVAVLVLTMHDDDETVLAALRAGARGYLLKGADQEEIRRAVHAVVAGEMIVAPGAAAHVVARLAAPAAPAVPFPELTPRERDVLDALARGRPNGTIAADLGLAPKTVGNHVSAIFTKLGVATRAEAVVRARHEGLGGSG